MKYKKVAHWESIEKKEGLLFFAQILDEALFDYTIDSYKPQALNSRLLCVEAIQNLQMVKNGIISKANLKPIFEELLWSINSDLALKKMLGNKLTRFVEKIKKENSHRDIINTIQLLYHHLDDRKYLNTIKELLIEKIPINKEKENIYLLTKSFLTELINYKYNPNHIYHRVNNYFFNRDNPVVTDNPEEFFSFFDFKEHEYFALYKVSSLFNEFKDAIEGIGINIGNKLDDFSGSNIQEKQFLKLISKDETYATCSVQCLDEVSARIQSEALLSKMANFFSFYHHKVRPSISDKAIIINKETGQRALLEKSLKSIIKKQDVKPRIAAMKVKNMFDHLNLNNSTLLKLGRAIDLHSSALETGNTENKLLNLWTAIESLIPKDIDANKDRVVQIIDGILPFQTHNYFTNLINQLLSDIRNFDKKLIQDVTSRIKIDSIETPFYTLAAFVTTSENTDVRNYAYSQLQAYPLLKWRLYSFKRMFDTAQSAKHILLNHKKKVEWQIQRIYRVRNLIVHSGNMPSYTNILVENLHDYFDNFINTIIDLAISERRIKNISQGVLEIDFKFKNHIEALDLCKNEPTLLVNYKKIIG